MVRTCHSQCRIGRRLQVSEAFLLGLVVSPRVGASLATLVWPCAVCAAARLATYSVGRRCPSGDPHGHRWRSVLRQPSCRGGCDRGVARGWHGCGGCDRGRCRAGGRRALQRWARWRPLCDHRQCGGHTPFSCQGARVDTHLRPLSTSPTYHNAHAITRTLSRTPHRANHRPHYHRAHTLARY